MKKTIFNFFNIPYAHVSTVDGYFSLPKSEREHHGFYRKPYALPIGDFFSKNGNPEKGWSQWDAEIKKQYPVQYFFREYLTSYDFLPTRLLRQIKWKIDDCYHNVKRFFKPCHNRFRKAYPRWKYRDLTEAIVAINFGLILDFWHGEVVGGHVNWQATPHHKKFHRQLSNVVDWIENKLPSLQEQSDKAMTAGNSSSLPYKKAYKKHDDLEKKIKEKQTEILSWMIENRCFFWT